MRPNIGASTSAHTSASHQSGWRALRDAGWRGDTEGEEKEVEKKIRSDWVRQSGAGAAYCTWRAPTMR